MEHKMVIIPFDLETAKRIREGKISGSLSDLIMELRIACFGKHLKNWIWMLVMPHGFTSPAAATTASTIWGSTYAIVDQNIR